MTGRTRPYRTLGSNLYVCERCGIERVKTSRPNQTGICRDCRDVESCPPDDPARRVGARRRKPETAEQKARKNERRRALRAERRAQEGK